jgi:hypothetical protein
MLKCIFQEPFSIVYRAYRKNCQFLIVTSDPESIDVKTLEDLLLELGSITENE